jgi:hypothetical protein
VLRRKKSPHRLILPARRSTLRRTKVWQCVLRSRRSQPA